MVVGAIGTLDIVDVHSAEWLASNLRSWLARWDVRLAYTNLEGQAGKVWAGVLVSASIPYRVVAHASSLDKAAQPYLDQASAVHILETHEPNDSWEQIQSASDVVIGLAAAPVPNSKILRSLEEACGAHCAAVLVDHGGLVSRVMCREGKW